MNHLQENTSASVPLEKESSSTSNCQTRNSTQCVDVGYGMGQQYLPICRTKERQLISLYPTDIYQIHCNQAFTSQARQEPEILYSILWIVDLSHYDPKNVSSGKFSANNPLLVSFHLYLFYIFNWNHLNPLNKWINSHRLCQLSS